MKVGSFASACKPSSMQLCKDSTLHGFIHCSQSSTWLGLSFWLFVTFGTLGLGTWFSADLVKGFLADPILQSVSITNAYVNGLQFPPITICFNHRTTNELLAKANMTTKEFEYLTFSLMSINSVMPVNSGHLQQLYQKYSYGNNSQLNFTDKRAVESAFRHLTPSCSDLIRACLTNGFTSLNCCADANYETIINFNGPCVEMSFLLNYTQKLAGVAGGVLLGLSLPDASNYPNATFFAYLLDGVQVFVSSYHATLEVNPIYIARGTNAMVEVSLQESFNLASPYCDSSKNATLDMQNSVNNRRYYECLVTCKREAKFRICNCMGLTSFDNASWQNFCTPAQARDCYYKISLNMIEQIDLNCSQVCIDNCHKKAYSLSVSSAPISRQQMSAAYANELNLPDKNVDNVIALYIYFPDIRYTVIKETYTQTWQTLLATVGGIYGLWSGASIVSLVHLFYFAMAKFVEKYKK